VLGRTQSFTVIAGDATTYTDNSPVAGDGNCYALFPLDAAGHVLGVSDFLCGVAGTGAGSFAPQELTLELDGTTTASLNWTAPAGGVDSYQLVVNALNRSPLVISDLPASATSATHAISTPMACYAVTAFRVGVGTSFGTILCAAPNLSSLVTLRPMGVQAAGDALLRLTSRFDWVALDTGQ
jgi:hypothetical protein